LHQEHVARPQEEKIMRGVSSMLLLFCSLSLVTAACGGDGGQQAATETGPATRTTEAPKKASKIPEAGQPLSPGKYVTTKFKRALTFRVVDEGWVNQGPEQPNYHFLGFDPPDFPLLLGFAIPSKAYDPERLPKRVAVPEPKDWVAWYQNHPYLTTGKATSVTVGGVSGTQFEAYVSSVPRDYPKICGGPPCISLWQMGTPDSEWFMWLGYKEQITILDVGGETVIIDVGAPEDDFVKLLPKAQKVVDTVEWEGT
jgi:hypothetical protein